MSSSLSTNDHFKHRQREKYEGQIPQHHDIPLQQNLYTEYKKINKQNAKEISTLILFMNRNGKFMEWLLRKYVKLCHLWCVPYNIAKGAATTKQIISLLCKICVI